MMTASRAHRLGSASQGLTRPHQLHTASFLQLVGVDPQTLPQRLWFAACRTNMVTPASLLDPIGALHNFIWSFKDPWQTQGLPKMPKHVCAQLEQQLVGLALFCLYCCSHVDFRDHAALQFSGECAAVCRAVLQPSMQQQLSPQQRAAVLPPQQQQLVYSKLVMGECVGLLPGMLSRLVAAMQTHMPGSSSSSSSSRGPAAPRHHRPSAAAGSRAHTGTAAAAAGAKCLAI